MNCLLSGDHHSLSLTRIQVHFQPVTPLTNSYEHDSRIKGKGIKSSMAWSLPVENLLPQLECGVNYQLLAVFTEVAQLGTPSCSRPN